MSEGMLHDGVIGFMFAGHETTASALARLLQYLRGSPQVLAMLRTEQERLASQHGLQLTGDLPHLLQGLVPTPGQQHSHMRRAD